MWSSFQLDLILLLRMASAGWEPTRTHALQTPTTIAVKVRTLVSNGEACSLGLPFTVTLASISRVILAKTPLATASVKSFFPEASK